MGKRKEFLLDYSSVSPFKALLLTPTCPPHHSPSSSSVLAQHQLWKEICRKEGTLLIRSLGPCYLPNCSHGGCMVWFQTRKPVAFCSGDSHHHHPRQENRTSAAFLNAQKNCCREEGSASLQDLEWQKAFTPFGQIPTGGGTNALGLLGHSLEWPQGMGGSGDTNPPWLWVLHSSDHKPWVAP